MKFLLAILIVLVAVVLVGAVLEFAFSRPKRLSRPEKKELQVLRDLTDDLTIMSSEHATLGDHFAVLALNRIQESRKEIR